MDYTPEQRREMERSFSAISPFEFKNKLIELAEGRKKCARALLDAGRGNPNWIASTPREAFFTLGQFAVQECRRVWTEQDLAGMAQREGIAERFAQYAKQQSDAPGMALLQNIVNYGIETKNFDPDLWVYELVDGIIGDNYPVPDRMLIHAEQVVRDFVVQELCGNDTTSGAFNLFAVEGATAAMCYLFETLASNFLLTRGDKIAITVPIFPPYVEIPELERYRFDVVEIHASGVDEQGNHTWQFPREEMEKLADPSIKAFFLVNPSNPPSVAVQPETVQQIVEIVKTRNPNLMIITDDVYSTFVDNFRSLMVDLPYNTVGVYSFSKYFGVTGWRLGLIAVHEHNVFDRLIQQLPDEQKQSLHKRYSSMTQHPDEVPFLDRIVADSRSVALNHTAGLSTPQQVQMAIFCAFALLDRENAYKNLTKDICRRRMRLLYEGLGLPQPQLKYHADYYTEFDLEVWSNHHYGKDFTDFLQKKYEPVDILFRLAENSSIVLLNGGGFHGPTWSIRVSLANLNDEQYRQIGEELHKALDQYAAEWKASQKTPAR
ncbi:aspartate 4-decarboxylase [Tumebacillus flagellatus]|uniref:Aminotransferase n=1 Tax=Tumebacillus flagellatus TaxID=1157490 RepID=A0A074LMG6_9BACL|nr:aspartate 4-decarboxylase [Tumebacillus flagellatus]KEO82319.1 aspartate aminotransferase [Tumebacillus flagellatus]